MSDGRIDGAKRLKPRLAFGFVALFGLVVLVAVAGELWRAPKRTMAELPNVALDEAWRRKAHTLLPRGTADRLVERRLAKAGLIVESTANTAYLVEDKAGCFRNIDVTWTLDGQGRLDSLKTASRTGCS